MRDEILLVFYEDETPKTLEQVNSALNEDRKTALTQKDVKLRLRELCTVGLLRQNDDDLFMLGKMFA